MAETVEEILKDLKAILSIIKKIIIT